MPKHNPTKESPLFQSLLKAKSALTDTIQKILDLNKSLRQARQNNENQAIRQELKLLNRVADQQAKIVQLYEARIRNTGNG